MNFEQHDIEESRTFLLELVEKGNLNIEIDKINEFVDFIANNTTPDSLLRTLIQRIQAYSTIELRNLEETFLNEADFDEVLSKSFQLENRRQLKKKLIELDIDIAEVLLDETIQKAFRIEKRDELKQKLSKIETESKPKETKVISMKNYLKIISVAASIILIFLFWQPQHVSDKILFANYTSNLDNGPITDFTKADLIKEQTGLRGEEEHFRNYSYSETRHLLEAIELVKNKDFEKAKEVFNRFNVEKVKNPGLALYLSIAELNSGNLDDAIKNLEYLAKKPDFSYQDEAKFHLSFAYLKSGERNKAKELLGDLVKNKSKLSEQARQTLKKIRWF